MDFVVGLPCSPSSKDAIWVVIDRFTNVSHFIPMKTTNSASGLVPLYVKEVVMLHGVPKSIVSDCASNFVSNFWKCLYSALGTGLDLCFSPSDRCQLECTIQILEDLLRSCVLS